MESPGRRIPPVFVKSHSFPVRDPLDLPFLLQSFTPSTTEDYFALANAYALSNDLCSARAVLEHLRSEAELALFELRATPAAAAASTRPAAEGVCQALLRVVNGNLAVLAEVEERKRERDNILVSFLEILPRDQGSTKPDSKAAAATAAAAAAANAAANAAAKAANAKAIAGHAAVVAAAAAAANAAANLTTATAGSRQQ